MKTMTVEEFIKARDAQGVENIAMDTALVCPMCKTVQSIRDLIKAGAGLRAIQQNFGFSCFGRFTGAPAPRATPDGNPCNWTLAGLLSMHQLEVVSKDGKRYPHFELATPEQAQQHAAKHAAAPRFPTT
jgi:hypothetical protein